MAEEKKFVYEVVDANEDTNFSVIRKSNVTVDFTIAELMEHEGRIQRVLTEAKAKAEMEKAAMENVEHFHKEVVDLVKDLEPEKQHAAFLWLQSKAVVAELEPKIEEIIAALEEHQNEVNDIKDQINWVAPDISVLNKKNNGEESAE